MKLGLYSITYLGLWYRGEALPLGDMIRRAKEYGYDGIEIDGKRPHGNPLDWPTSRCRELRSQADGQSHTVGNGLLFPSGIPRESVRIQITEQKHALKKEQTCCPDSC